MASFTIQSRTMLFIVVGVVLWLSSNNGNAVVLGPRESAEVYDVYPTGRYFYNTAFMNWTNAYKTCQNRKSHLVVINSPEEANAIVEMINLYFNPDIEDDYKIHVGVHDRFQENDFVTILDESLPTIGYSQWADSYPVSSGGNCVLFDGDKVDRGLKNVACTALAQSICEERLWDDFEELPDYGLYKFYTRQQPWPLAWQTCHDVGAHLLVLNSQREADKLYEYYDYFYNWVGVHQRFGMGQFVTISNDDLYSSGFSTWHFPEFYPDTDYLSHPFCSVYRNEGHATEYWDWITTFVCEYERPSSL